MNCPNCKGLLLDETYENFPVKRCNTCYGVWLDAPELTEVEDTVWADEDLKGSLEDDEKPTTLNCPVCNKLMIRFNYRYYDSLKMDTCPDMHGFWLDNEGGIDQIKELMKKDMKSEERSIKAEKEWSISLERMRSGGFINKVKSFLNL